jgi:hypothetical protein
MLAEKQLKVVTALGQSSTGLVTAAPDAAESSHFPAGAQEKPAQPRRGSGHIAGDGCSDAPRHVQAVMPDEQSARWNAQCFAIDWELLYGQNRVWVPQPDRESRPRVED